MRFTTLLQTTAVILLGGCNALPTACTLIGCEDALIVRFDEAPTGAYRVEAIPASGAAPSVVECAADQACAPIRFADFTAETVTLRVTTAAGTQSRQFQPNYESQYPNGRDCGAACKVATVTFTF